MSERDTNAKAITDTTTTAATATAATTTPTMRDPICAVCAAGISVDDVTSRAIVHEGVRHAFCSERCRERFVNEPARFLVSWIETA